MVSSSSSYIHLHPGYEKAADVAKTALKEGKTLKQVAVSEKKYLSLEEFDAAVVPHKMTQPAPAAGSSRKTEL